MTNGKEESTAGDQPVQAGAGEQRQLTCFVVAGRDWQGEALALSPLQ